MLSEYRSVVTARVPHLFRAFDGLIPARICHSLSTTLLTLPLLPSSPVSDSAGSLHELSVPTVQVLLVDENTCSDGEACAEAFRRFKLGVVSRRRHIGDMR